MLKRSDRVENSDPVKFVLVDVPEAQVGEVGQVGELGQCQRHVVLHIHQVNSLIFKCYSISYSILMYEAIASRIPTQSNLYL